jgi:hypothetical protein
MTMADIISIISKDTILLINYTNTTVKINDNPFRESISCGNALFPIQLNENNYFLQNYNSYNIITNHSNYQFQSGLTNKFMYKNTKTRFEQIDFTLNGKKKVHIVSTFSAKNLKGVDGSLKIQLILNKNILQTDIFRYTNTFHYNAEIILPKGNYVLATVATSLNGTWCSCPETSNGFTTSRFIAKWEYNTYLRI